MNCQSCGISADLHVRKSSLFDNFPLLQCDECRSKKLEPRWLVILYGRQYGIKQIGPVLKAHRYVGKEISATELV